MPQLYLINVGKIAINWSPTPTTISTFPTSPSTHLNSPHANNLTGCTIGGGPFKHNPDKSTRISIKMRAGCVIKERCEQSKSAIAFVSGYSSQTRTWSIGRLRGFDFGLIIQIHKQDQLKRQYPSPCDLTILKHPAYFYHPSTSQSPTVPAYLPCSPPQTVHPPFLLHFHREFQLIVYTKVIIARFVFIYIVMEFDILNQLITSTVGDLFTNTEKIVIQSKQKVKELETLIKQQNNQRKGSIHSDRDGSFSVVSDGSSRDQPQRAEPPRYKSIQEWKEHEADKRRKQAFSKLGLDQSLMKAHRKIELEQYIQTMSVEGLANEKKKVKNQLKSYDNDFAFNFKRQPNHDEKEPLRPLYVYYKKLKESLTRRGGEQMSQERIQAMIANIKKERRELREQIESYQRDFEQNNNRRIRYVRDIAPIDTQYRKYKELKMDLQKYEEMLNK